MILTWPRSVEKIFLIGISWTFPCKDKTQRTVFSIKVIVWSSWWIIPTLEILAKVTGMLFRKSDDSAVINMYMIVNQPLRFVFLYVNNMFVLNNFFFWAKLSLITMRIFVLILLKILEVRLRLLEREHLIYLILKQDRFSISNVLSLMFVIASFWYVKFISFSFFILLCSSFMI